MNNTEAKKLSRLKTLSVALDSKIEGPMGIRFGLDALVGLVPVVGDLLTTVVSFYIIAQGVRLGCSFPIAFRMVLNLFWENFIGTIPFLGNLFDFYWKANNKNVALIEGYLHSPKRSTRNSTLILSVLILIVLGMLSFTVYLGIQILALIISFISQIG